MDITIQRKPAFRMAGISTRGVAGAGGTFTALWEQLFERFAVQELIRLGDGQSYGACYDMHEDGSFAYMAGFDLADEKKAKALGLEILSIPEAEYAVVALTGPVPQSIIQGWQHLTGDFFPKHGYRHAYSPDFEVYADGDMQSPCYQMALWVPIEKAE